MCPEETECCTFNAFYHSCEEYCPFTNATATLFKRCFTVADDMKSINLLPDVCQGNTTCQLVNQWYAQCLLDDMSFTSQSV